MQRKAHVNSLIKEVKAALRLHSSATQVEDVDLYSVSMDEKRVQRFCEIVRLVKREVVIFEDSVRGFRIEARREPFRGAIELKSACGVKTSLAEAFRKYDKPYEYLLALRDNEALSRSDLYKLFVKISYRILNEDGFEVSGGERSEFRLLEEIIDAQNCDILLIDEPESSFDNLFLKSDVNQILKSISKNMPVVVVTHNSTVGASVGADYILCTRKEVEGGNVVYRTYSGYPTDKQLFSTDGQSVANHEIMMNALEAGTEAYEDRRKGYEAIKY